MDNPREFGEILEKKEKTHRQESLEQFDTMLAETAESMPRKPKRSKIRQDPKIQELVRKRATLQRSCDGRERFSITAEIRKLITKDTRNRKREAINIAFARHTNWAKISNELRINRPTAPPIFRVDGKSITSDEEAMAAMAGYIEQVYAEPKRPIQIPPWDKSHGIQVGDLIEAVGMAVAAVKAGKATDASGLSNGCMKGMKHGAVEEIAALLKENKEASPQQWKKAQGLFLHKKRGIEKFSRIIDC